MRIAYLCYEDFSNESGVAKKICLQAGYWARAGHTVSLIAPRMRGQRFAAAANLDIHEFDFPLGSRKYLDSGGMGIRETREFQPDVIYNRYFILPPWHLSLARDFRLVFEINSEESEFALYNSRPKRMLHSLWRKQYLRTAAGAVFISHELSEKPQFGLLEHRTVIANGIDRPSRAVPSKFIREPGPARIFFIGNGPFSWHGIDKIAYIAKHIPDVQVDIVGDPRPDPCPPNVRCHGPLPKAEYLSLLQRADVALGPLSLHTKSLLEASPLKVREYLYHGIPTIVAYQDTDIPTSTAHTLHIPNTPDNVINSLQTIASFIEFSKGKRIDWEAVSNLDAQKKEEQRLGFFRSCLANAVRRAA